MLSIKILKPQKIVVDGEIRKFLLRFHTGTVLCWTRFRGCLMFVYCTHGHNSRVRGEMPITVDVQKAPINRDDVYEHSVFSLFYSVFAFADRRRLSALSTPTSQVLPEWLPNLTVVTIEWLVPLVTSNVPGHALCRLSVAFRVDVATSFALTPRWRVYTTVTVTTAHNVIACFVICSMESTTANWTTINNGNVGDGNVGTKSRRPRTGKKKIGYEPFKMRDQYNATTWVARRESRVIGAWPLRAF